MKVPRQAFGKRLAWGQTAPGSRAGLNLDIKSERRSDIALRINPKVAAMKASEIPTEI